MLWLLLGSVQAGEQYEQGQLPEYNMQNFRGALGRQDMLWINESRIDGSNLFTFRNMFVYSKSMLSYRDYKEERISILEDVLETDFLASYTFGSLQFGMGIPLYLRATNDSTAGGSGIGDVWLDAKVRLLNRTKKKFGAAISLRSTLPTSTLALPLGTKGLLMEGEIDLDKEAGPAVFALNIGYRHQPSIKLDSISLGPQIFSRFGVSYHMDETVGFSTELSAAWSTSDLSNTSTSPFEILLGSWKRFASNEALVLRGGVGLGLNGAISTPAARGLLGVSYEPVPFKDSDSDKVMDSKDACPNEAEDLDGVQDNDGCPEPTNIVFSAVDQFGAVVPEFRWTFDGREGDQTEQSAVFGGLHPIAVSAVGHKDLQMDIEIPNVQTYDYQIVLEALLADLRIIAVSSTQEELPSAIWTATGKGMPENIPGSRTAPVRVGSNEIIVRAPGYRRITMQVNVLFNQANEYTIPLQFARARWENGQILIDDKVFFAQDSDVILESSYNILSEVAEILQDNPEITKIRVEGHTDAVGEAQYNLDLSQKRAQSVRNFLIGQGIDASRLLAIGLGESRAIDSNRNANGRANNRRVEFHVEETASGPAPNRAE